MTPHTQTMNRTLPLHILALCLAKAVLMTLGQQIRLLRIYYLKPKTKTGT